MVVDYKTSNDKTLLNHLFSYSSSQENIKYIIFVIISGFSAGFFAWSISIEKDLFYGFILRNILSPEDRMELLVFLFTGIMAALGGWVLLSNTLYQKRKERPETLLNRTSSWIFTGAVLWFFPILSIRAIEVYYPFQIFFLLLGMLILVSYIVFVITRHIKSFSESNISKWNSDRIGLFLVILISTGYALFFTVYTVSRHYSFHSFSFDLGWQNQVFYTLVHKGWPRVTLFIDLAHMGNHFQPLYYLLAPIYALFQDPVTLLVLQALFLASSAVPLYLIAKKRLKNVFLSVIISAVFLLYPALHGLNTFDFHGLVLFIPIITFMLYFLETDRMKPFWVFFALALITREDTPVTLIGVGLYIFLIMKKRKLGVLVTASSFIYFFIVLFTMSALGGFANTENYTAIALTESQGFKGALITLFTNPFFAFKHVFFNSDKLVYLFQIFLPVLFLPFFAPKRMLIALPGFAIILLSSHDPQYSIDFQYSAHIISLVFYMSIYGIENIQRKWPQVKNVVVAIPLLSAGIFMNYEYGLILSKRFHGIPKATEREKIAYSFFEDIPRNASLVTNSRLYPHLSGREEINLICRMDEDIEYILADLYPPSPALDLCEAGLRSHTLDKSGVKAIVLKHLKRSDFGVVRYSNGFVLLKRGNDTSKNRSTGKIINSLEFETGGKIYHYFSDPAGSIPEPFTSVSDLFIKFLEKHRSDTIIISVKNDARKRLTYTSGVYLMTIGSKINTLKKGGSYIAIIHKNRVIFEKISNSSAIEIDNIASEKVKVLFFGNRIEVSSAGYKHGNYSSIKINGTEYSENRRGFNTVVLNSYMRVKEAVNFDMGEKVYRGEDKISY